MPRLKGRPPMLRRRSRRLRRDFGHRAHRAFQGKEKNAVAARRTSKETAARVHGDVFVALVLEDAGGSIHAGAGLEFPKALAARGIERGEPPIVAAHEGEAARRRDRAAVAAVFPALLPDQL